MEKRSILLQGQINFVDMLHNTHTLSECFCYEISPKLIWPLSRPFSVVNMTQKMLLMYSVLYSFVIEANFDGGWRMALCSEKRVRMICSYQYFHICCCGLSAFSKL